MVTQGNKKKERIEKLEEGFASLTESVRNMETKMGKMQNETCNTLQARIDNLRKNGSYYGIAAIIVLVLAVAILYAMLIGANKKIDVLQEKVQALQSTNVVSVMSTQPNATEEFINAVFPVEDGIWYDYNGNTFYRDPDCKYAIISDPEFCNHDYIFGEDSSGNRIEVYRLTDGSFAYIPSNFSVILWRK